MKLTELRNEIDRLIKAPPYTRAEIVALWLWVQEDEEPWLPENLLTLAAAYEYLHKTDNSKEANNIRGRYERLLGELKERYAPLRPSSQNELKVK